MRRYRSMSNHHIVPRSRQGINAPSNIVGWDESFHDAYHRLFKNLTLEEAITMLRIVSIGEESWDRNRLEALRQVLMNRGLQE
jgi:hypothetical protein